MANIKETPILFSGEMVRAILEGRKTQTRRAVKPKKLNGEVKQNPENIFEVANYSINPPSIDAETGWYVDLGDDVVIQHCPFGEPGDRLWVREAHSLDPPLDGTWGYYDYTDGVSENIAAIPERFRIPKYVIYRADADDAEKCRWRPSIHMPRWASRIDLEITNVRVERLHDISADDVTAEGVGEAFSKFKTFSVATDRQAWESATVRMFSHLWDKINGKKHPWASDPWVWVVDFRRI